jgi:hypothetical protein
MLGMRAFCLELKDLVALPDRTQGIAFNVKGHVSVNPGTTLGLRFD